MLRNKSLLILAILFCLCGCSSDRTADKSDTIVSMQVVDRNGFSETISSSERLKPFQASDFLSPQPFQKVLRVYGRSPAGKTQSKITSYHPNGQPWQYLEVVDGRAHGAYREWYANGQQRIDIHVIEGLADINDLSQSSWIFDGEALIWDEYGNQMAQFHYDKGLINAPAHYYHPNGKLHKIIPYTNGLREGEVLVYDEEGTLLKKNPYSAGKKHGDCITLWAPGLPLSTEHYCEGKLQSGSYASPKGELISSIQEGRGKRAQFESGRLHTLTEFEEGVPCGKVETYHPDGSLLSFYTIKEGKKTGEEVEYFYPIKKQRLQPKLALQWHEDTLQGQVKTWYENGIMESQREMNENKKQGVSAAWYKTGEIMLVEEYQNDLLIKGSYYKKGDKQAISHVEEGKGHASLFTSDGIFLKKIPYEKGKPQMLLE